jgi:hypothetical protein
MTYPKKYQLLGTGEPFLQKIGRRGRAGWAGGLFSPPNESRGATLP